MQIGVIDADIIGRRKHRFPNLASMKISSYHNLDSENPIESLTMICNKLVEMCRSV